MTVPTPFALALHEIRTSGRTRALLAAIVLGCMLVVAGAVLGASMQQRVGEGAEVAHEGVDIVVRSEQGAAVDADSAIGGGSSMGEADLSGMSELSGVEAAAGLVRARAALVAGDSVRSTVVESVPSEGFRWQRLDEGRLPGQGTEIALSRDTLRETGLRVGDTVMLGTAASGQAPFTVVGVLDTRGALAYQSTAYGIVTEPVARAVSGLDGYNEIALRLTPGADADAVIDAVNSTVPVGWPQKTSEISAATQGVYGVGLGVLTAMINGFSGVAAMIAVVVLATVVWASLPGRREQLSLLRLVGATRGQLAAVVALETGAIALLGSLIALPVGVALAYVVVPLVGLLPDVPALSWADVRVPVAPLAAVPVGAVVAGLIASAVPVAAVCRISPAGARRAAAAPFAPSRARAAILLIGGAVALVLLFFSARYLGVYWTAALAAVVTVLWIAATPTVTGLLAGWGARLAEHRAPVAALTLSGLQRFPGRAAATGLGASLAAVVIAVSLVTLSSVAAVSAARTSAEPGPDLLVGAYAGSTPLDDDTIGYFSEVDGIERSVPVTSSRLTLAGPSATPGGGPEETRVASGVVSVEPADLAAASDGRFPLTDVSDDEVYLPTSTMPPFAEGSDVTVTGPDGEVTLTARYVDGLPFQAFVAPGVLEGIGARTQVPALWLSLGPDVPRAEILDSVRAVATLSEDLPVSGTAVTDARIDGVVAVARGLAVGMLAVAVAIAIIGAAVTVSTTLRERSTELSVLRMLGMDSRRLRHSVAGEAWVVGAVSVITGLALGVVLGSAATLAVAMELGLDPRIRVPIVTLIVLGAATVVGLRLAVSAPLDRVSIVPPARALRDSRLGEDA